MTCVFCDRSQFEERIIDETRYCYLIASLGQITDGGYVLVVPKKHLSCMGALAWESPMMLDDVRELVSKASDAVAREFVGPRALTYSSVTLFEHGIVGQTIKHAHLHILPAHIDMTERVSKDFGPPIQRSKLEIQHHYDAFQRPYLYWTCYGDNMFCWDPPAPSQYLRIVAAQILGRPERANWRTMDPELDKRLWSETVRRLRPYFS